METALMETKSEAVHSMARKIAKAQPKLEALSPEELEQLARVVVAESLRDELKAKVNLEKIDYPDARRRFLATLVSKHTRRSYATGIALLEAWCAEKHMSVLELTHSTADRWIEAMKVAGKPSGTVRQRTAAASAFLSWLERDTDDLISNPIRGTKARPKHKSTRALAVPSEKEIRILEAKAGPELRAAIVSMASTGLRVGGLPPLTINGDRWRTTSKGKDINGKVPDVMRKAIEEAGLPMRGPFANLTEGGIADHFRYLTKGLYEAGKIGARYSVHDLRHAFAVRLYLATHDIYKAKEALYHESISTTERYLKSLNVRD